MNSHYSVDVNAEALVIIDTACHQSKSVHPGPFSLIFMWSSPDVRNYNYLLYYMHSVFSASRLSATR